MGGIREILTASNSFGRVSDTLTLINIQDESDINSSFKKKIRARTSAVSNDCCFPYLDSSSLLKDD